MKFSAVAFDLDGTLYPNFRFYIRLVPFLLKELRLLTALGKARTQLRRSYLDSPEVSAVDSKEEFYDVQARIMSRILGKPAEVIKDKTEKLIYRGWEPIFRKVRLFSHVLETLDAFRANGVKMGLLSDFPPETKLENLGIGGYWDAVICSEQTGRLKPDKKPFFDLAEKMGLPAKEILYVGNSISYDVKGAFMAGMKSALVRPKWKKFPSVKEANFIFYNYRQLRDYVLS